MWPTHAMSKGLRRMGWHVFIGEDDMRPATAKKGTLPAEGVWRIAEAGTFAAGIANALADALAPFYPIKTKQEDLDIPTHAAVAASDTSTRWPNYYEGDFVIKNY